MSVKLFQNFEPESFENWTLHGNAALSSVHKFSNKSVLFHTQSDSISASNTSGIFNLAQASNKDFECFFKPAFAPLDIEAINSIDNSIKFFNGHAFKIFYNNQDWLKSKSLCEAYGGHLAIIPDQDTQNFFNETLLPTSSYDFWLGGYKDNDTWLWVNGEPISYFNWQDNLDDYNYIDIHTSNRKWEADPLEGRYNDGFICEWDNILALSIYLDGYRFFNGHSFKLFTMEDTITWNYAENYCENLGGHLATCTSDDKKEFLCSLSDRQTYLGATHLLEDGVWKWITGEVWSYTTDWWGGSEPSTSGNDYGLSMFVDTKTWVVAPTDLKDARNFICEWDTDFRTLGFLTGNIFNFDNSIALKINSNATLTLSSSAWNINATSETTVSADNWHHILLRIQNSSANVYLDGSLIINANISGNDITPSSFTLGGFSGYIDDFVVLDDCDNNVSDFNSPYNISKGGTSIRTSSAPVSYAVWSCSNLPDGLTLSDSGLLQGTPTVAGTFNCNVSLTTNWGTANKSIRIVIANA